MGKTLLLGCYLVHFLIGLAAAVAFFFSMLLWGIGKSLPFVEAAGWAISAHVRERL